MVTKVEYLSTKNLANKLEVDFNNLCLKLAKKNLIYDNHGIWDITPNGERNGAEYKKYWGNIYIAWPISFIESQLIKSIIPELKKNETYRRRPGHIETEDGHLVRSKPERIIDDILFNMAIPHVYEKKIPYEYENLYCDFWIPSKFGGLYVEYWGLLDSVSYFQNAEKKRHIYKCNHLHLLEIEPENLVNIKDILINKFNELGVSYI